MDKYEELKEAVEEFIEDVRKGSYNWNSRFGRLKKISRKINTNPQWKLKGDKNESRLE